VLAHLRDSGSAETVTAVAAAVGLHENTARFHLDALIEAGLVRREAESRRQPGRPRVLYRADAVPGQQAYRDLATAMVRHFAGELTDRGARAEAAGQAWGAELRAGRPADGDDGLPGVVACLARLGYQPELVAGPPATIGLRSCPYVDLAAGDRATVCELHLGLLRGLLKVDGPWEVTALEPHGSPGRCVVQLEPRATAS
jgi:predicted ArsR family transcriptional regulator